MNSLVLFSLFAFLASTINPLEAQSSVEPGEEDLNRLNCVREERRDLSRRCRQLRVFNRIQLTSLTSEDKFKMARRCACELNSMPWEAEFVHWESIERIAGTVDNLLASDKYGKLHRYPTYLWSDVDTIIKGVSIRLTILKYFTVKEFMLTKDPEFYMLHEKDPLWYEILDLCETITIDRLHLYGFLENLQRLSPITFYHLLDANQFINATYKASKMCKLLVVERLPEYLFVPNSLDLIKANQNEQLTGSELMDELNSIQDTPDGDVDTALRHASITFKQCDHFQRSKLSIGELKQHCSMMFSSHLPVNWIQENKFKSESEKTRIALKCGCQLLLHNASWVGLMKNTDVDTMSKALTFYMNEIKFPNVQKVPLWALHGWFENTMKRFEQNRRLSIKEIIKFKHDNQDPTQAINGKTMDEYDALELIRRACNLVVLNVGPKGRVQTDEIKLIQHLDNLQYISLDPQFVFHLTLQDANLFKLYAISKMCKPVLK